MVNFFIEGGWGYPNQKKRKCESYINIGVRVLWKFVGWVQPDTDQKEGEKAKIFGVSLKVYLGPEI